MVVTTVNCMHRRLIDAIEANNVECENKSNKQFPFHHYGLHQSDNTNLFMKMNG